MSAWYHIYNPLSVGLNSGNSGFETAQNIVGSAAYIHLASRSRVKHAYQTHYVGDLRAINNQLVDTYQLKSLDGFLGMCVVWHACHDILYSTHGCMVPSVNTQLSLYVLSVPLCRV